VALALLAMLIALPLAAQTETQEVGAASISHDAFQLTPAAPSITRQVVVDATTAVSFHLTAASRTLNVSLVAPDATRYSLGDPDTSTFESGFYPIDTVSTTPGASYLLTVSDPQPGTWTLEVSEGATLSAPLDVVTVTLLNNSTTLVLLGGGDSYPAGSDIRLALVAFDGFAKVPSLTITGKLFRPFDPTFTPQTVTFHDDGTGGDETANDGIFETFINPGTAGTYQVQADVDGTASTGAFHRSAGTELKVVPHNAAITGFTDHGIDNDFDGLFDQVDIVPTANILEAGDYMVSVRLRASNGHEMQRSVNATFGTGSVSTDVTFSAADITRDLGVDGPWQVAEVRFFEMVGSDPVPADIRYDLGPTGAYTLGGLQHGRLQLNGSGFAEGLDTNGNGLYDFLHTAVGVTADFGGFYQYSVSLTDRNGKELGFTAGFLFLNAGDNTLDFTFPGQPIGQNGVDGPYFVSNLILFGAGQSLVATTALTTQPFTASQFEGFILDHTPPVVTVSVTPSVLYPPNHLMVEITPTVTATDDHDPNPVINLASITSNEAGNMTGDGNTSNDILVTNGRIFVRSERSGNAKDRVYTITYTARDFSGNVGVGSATVTVPHDKGSK
jgi:hypothetical protein